MWEAEISTTSSHPVKRPSAVCSPVRRVLTLTRAWCNGQTFRLPWPPPACRSRTRHTLEATQCSPYTALLQEVPRARLSTTVSLSEQPLSPTPPFLCMAAVPAAPPPAPPLSSPTPLQQLSSCLKSMFSPALAPPRHGRSSPGIRPHQTAQP